VISAANLRNYDVPKDSSLVRSPLGKAGEFNATFTATNQFSVELLNGPRIKISTVTPDEYYILKFESIGELLPNGEPDLDRTLSLEPTQWSGFKAYQSSSGNVFAVGTSVAATFSMMQHPLGYYQCATPKTLELEIKFDVAFSNAYFQRADGKIIPVDAGNMKFTFIGTWQDKPSDRDLALKWSMTAYGGSQNHSSFETQDGGVQLILSDARQTKIFMFLDNGVVTNVNSEDKDPQYHCCMTHRRLSSTRFQNSIPGRYPLCVGYEYDPVMSTSLVNLEPEDESGLVFFILAMICFGAVLLMAPIVVIHYLRKRRTDSYESMSPEASLVQYMDHVDEDEVARDELDRVESEFDRAAGGQEFIGENDLDHDEDLFSL